MTKENVNTPYDDAFRTLLVKCPTLVIPLVNEAFHEEYGLRENVSVFHNEFFIGDEYRKERITDSHIGIRDMTVKVVSSLAAKWPNVTKGVRRIMGGEILELEVDKILNRGIDIGKAEGVSLGRTEGLSIGRTEGRADGIITTLVSLVRDGLLDSAEGAKRANMTQEEFAQKLNDI